MTSSREHLIKLLPHLADLEIFDNSADATPGEDLPHPTRILEMKRGLVLYPPPGDVKALKAMPHWAKPILAAAFRLHEERGGSRLASPLGRPAEAAKTAPAHGAAVRSARRGKRKRP